MGVEDALALAAQGYRVFPLTPNDWRPAIKGWQDKATTDEAMIREWWKLRPNANVGVATGKGLLVLDIDVKKGKDGWKSLADLDLPIDVLDTPSVLTPSGGTHAYLRSDDDLANSAGVLGPGLDIRSAGGYVVGPGSVLPEGAKDGQPGGVYKWIEGRSATLRPAPAELTGRLRLAVGERVNGSAEHSHAADVSAATRWLESEARLAQEGQGGDHTTFVVAAHLKDLGVFEGDAFDLMAEHWNDRCSPPWTLEDLKTKVANAYRYGENPPGSKAPETAFGDVKIEAPAKPLRTPSKFFRHGMAFETSNTWLFYELAPALGVGVLVGETQSGKTFLEIEMARCGATGKPFFGVTPVDKFGTLFVFAGTEGSDIARRFAALGEDNHLPLSACYASNLSRPGALEGLLEDLQNEAAYIMETFGVRVGCVVVETLAASGLLLRENDAGEASAAMHNLATIANAMGVFVLTSHHPAKGTNESRGSGAVPAAADYVLSIKRNARDKVRQVELVKARSAEQRAIGSFSLVPVSLGKDDAGNEIKSMTVSMGDASHEVTRSARENKHAATVMQAIEFAAVDHGVDIDGERWVKRTYVWPVFHDLTKLQGEANQHRAMRAALEYLEGQGVVRSMERHGEVYLNRLEIFT